MVWDSLDLRILSGEPHNSLPDCITISSPPGRQGWKTLLFAFSLTLHPQPHSRVSKAACRRVVTLVPKPAGSRAFGGWGPSSPGCALQPCVPGPPPSVDSAGPFSLSQNTSPTPPTGGRRHVDANAHAVPWDSWRHKVGEGRASPGLIWERRWDWVVWLLFPLPPPGTKLSGLSSSCWVWGPCSPGIFS